MNKKSQEFQELSSQDLVLKIDELRRELFSLRLHVATSAVKDRSNFRKLRKSIARGLTFLRQKNLNQ